MERHCKTQRSTERHGKILLYIEIQKKVQKDQKNIESYTTKFKDIDIERHRDSGGLEIEIMLPGDVYISLTNCSRS